MPIIACIWLAVVASVLLVLSMLLLSLDVLAVPVPDDDDEEGPCAKKLCNSLA
jgi:hypothetical protein